MTWRPRASGCSSFLLIRCLTPLLGFSERTEARNLARPVFLRCILVDRGNIALLVTPELQVFGSFTIDSKSWILVAARSGMYTSGRCEV
ncbi:uncharacterized protein PHACADRAFT_246415 [Phanerochaete carnosa HHB-10118-sp]|uniref:Secreted protein n=1 Tax=Phanerochaete carnosa (strain HHB-10118-sp) TaxID=650164 RepID=K5W947_PHACS|nr:uncharacterized protein PHACADRAFT_246415 [Phanerochaete carnosa HHB-10118-sp]EKM60458.1 hypothetical protein PHACADRAFT_246415 [Phanerochaete carnosa HHB-10118-sp]